MAVSQVGDNRVPEHLDMIKWRGLAEKLDVFNASSAGAITLMSDPAFLATNPADYYEDVRFKTIASLDARANTAATGTITSLKLETLEGASVLQDRSLGPVEIADGFWRHTKATPAQVASNLGNQFAQAQLQALRNNAIAIAVGAATNAYSAAHYTDNTPGAATGARVPFTAAIAEGMLNDMADARDDMLVWVMPSIVFSNLITANLAYTSLDTVAGSVLNKGMAYSFMGLPILVVDAPALTTEMTSSYYTKYGVLLMGAGAVNSRIVFDDPTETDRTITTTSKITTYRGQYGVDFSVQGAKWDITNGSKNPTDATLATATNWDTDGEDHREFPIVLNLVNSIA